MSDLALRNVVKRFDDITAVNDISLEVSRGETVVLLGPSGCGKTTCLRLLAGFEHPDEGTIEVDGRILAGPEIAVPPEKRGMSVVFQSYALWPHMTVADNVAYGPRNAKRAARDSAGRIRQRVEETLELVQLGGFDDRYPHQLSGGQQQRVALARALVTEPSILLLDEPLSNLDTRLREEMRFEVKRLQELLDVTMVYVTHDQAEALSLADRVVVMRAGRIEQIGTPSEVYRRPRNGYVAGVLGTTNLIPGEVTRVGDDLVTVSTFTGYDVQAAVAEGHTVRVGHKVELSIRPADVHLTHLGAEEVAVRGQIEAALFFGDVTQYAVLVEGWDQPLKVTAPGLTPFEKGSSVAVEIPPASATVLAPT